MLLVADRAQDIYNRGRTWTEEAMTGCGFHGPWSEFRHSHRLPSSLIPHLRRFATLHLTGVDETLPDQRQGELELSPCHMQWIQALPHEGVERCVEEILKLPKYSSELSWADICLITDSRESGAAVVMQLNDHKIQVHHTFLLDWRERQSAKRFFFKGASELKATTIHSFKGWEGRAVVVFMSGQGAGSSAELLYTALTRVKRHDAGCWISVINCVPEWTEYGSTWPIDVT